MASKRQIKPCGIAVEGIYYTEKPDMPHDEWVAEANEYAAKIWGILGQRPARLFRKISPLGYFGQTHALRTKKRGYGEKAKHWQSTTECGQIMRVGQGWDRLDERDFGTLGEATCLMCREVVRERFERDLEYGELPDEAWDAYEQQIDEPWRIQAEWHQMGQAGDDAYRSYLDSLPPTQVISAAFGRGDRVRHEDYGYGTVIASSVLGSEEMVLVRFDSRPDKPKNLSLSVHHLDLAPRQESMAGIANWVGEGVLA